MPAGRPPLSKAQKLVLRTLGQNIARLRQQAGLTQEQLADLLGQHGDDDRRANPDRVEVSRTETGDQNISVTRLIDYARALDVTPNDLLANTH